ncbi:tRNA dimethylallyltransferase [Aureimonas endophytica]|uniref:tRNA dimethylallyltransferase n=1 Tax=Aureimonas endophytica TaxID=2027858 RepID=A0A916ZE94_9HYPH|nr:tRNA (adenosine(37)-N6)-dimethylallyltransferase MiaA [Aureimonas endophytica]GGD91969.1 tRNA dimethylallyltransferase [Aureimonas endophytica]
MTRKDRQNSAVLIAGPTASGKSALALAYARRLGGTVVNADSMQVYRGIEILSAQPSDADLAAVPHRLYGHVDPATDYSVGAWMRDVEPLLADLREAGRVPIVVGGTGLYFRALLGGIDAMPAVPAAIRETYRARALAEGPAALHEELRRLDPAAAARIRPSDPQRIVRALELVTATGRPIGEMQQGAGRPLIDTAAAIKIVLRPPRALLRERIARRFHEMMAAGALEEAARFRRGELVAGATAGKAIGLPELLDHLAGGLSLPEAVERAITRSRQYAKRQDTWFRHQLDASWQAREMPELSSMPD